MAKGNALATAYIQLIPSMEGAQAEIRQQLGAETNGVGESVGGSIAKKIKKAIVSAGIGTAITATVKSAFSEGSALEQSIGGIETLFKKSAGTMEQYAKDAYRTAGLSANDYMEQATGFAAGLISSTGGDTAKAADIANQALIDMSDNANKMGTNMEDLQNAYQGFAKQNFTMLDNLKLGYGGTKEEMERLLSDAEKLTGVHYDISNLGDVYSAIHAIQENLDITGTTSKEASETFSGSFAAMKSAAQNLLGYITTGMTDDIDQGMIDLLNTASNFLFDNAIPMLGRFVEQIPSVLTQGLNILVNRIREGGADAACEGVGGFLESMSETLPALVAAVARLAGAAGQWVIDHIDEIKEIGKRCIDAFVSSIAEELGMSEEMENGLKHMVTGSLKALAALKIGSMAKGIVTPIIKAFGPTGLIGKVLAPLTKAFTTAGGGLAGLKAALGIILSPVAIAGAAIGALVGVFAHLWTTNEGFRDAIGEIWTQIKDTFQGVCDGIVERLNALGFNFEDILDVISSLWEGFCQIMAPIFEGAFQWIADTFQTAVDVFFDIWDTFAALFSGDWEGVWDGVSSFVSDIWDGLVSYFSNILDTIIDLADVFLGWFGTDWETAWNGVSSFVSDIWDGISSAITGAWDGICSWLQQTGTNVFNAITQPFRDAYNTAVGWYNHLNDLWGGSDLGKWNPLGYSGDGTTSFGRFSMMADGGIFTRPTLFPDSRTIVGEAGAEAVLPLADFYTRLDKSVKASTQGNPADLERILGKLDELIGAVDITLDGRSVAKSVNRHLQRMAVAR